MGLFDKKQTGAMPPEVAECEKKIAELEARRTEMVMQIGMTFLANNPLEKLAGSPYEASAKAIADIDKEREFQEKRKLAVQGLRKCEKCGNILVRESAFCNKCGEKLEPLFAEETKNQNICPVCGAPYADGAAFCTSCGNKLGE